MALLEGGYTLWRSNTLFNKPGLRHRKQRQPYISLHVDLADNAPKLP